MHRFGSSCLNGLLSSLLLGRTCNRRTCNPCTPGFFQSSLGQGKDPATGKEPRQTNVLETQLTDELQSFQMWNTGTAYHSEDTCPLAHGGTCGTST